MDHAGWPTLRKQIFHFLIRRVSNWGNLYNPSMSQYLRPLNHTYIKLSLLVKTCLLRPRPVMQHSIGYFPSIFIPLTECIDSNQLFWFSWKKFGCSINRTQDSESLADSANLQIAVTTSKIDILYRLDSNTKSGGSKNQTQDLQVKSRLCLLLDYQGQYYACSHRIHANILRRKFDSDHKWASKTKKDYSNPVSYSDTRWRH